MQQKPGVARAEPPPIKDPLVAAAYRRKQKSSITVPAILLMIAFAAGAVFYGMLALITLLGALFAFFGGSGAGKPADQFEDQFKVDNILIGEELPRLAIFQEEDLFGPASEKELDNKSAPARANARGPSLGGRLIYLFAYAVMLVLNLGLCLGAYLTKRHESYPVAMMTCIAAIVPISILWCVSLPVGIWGIVALSGRDVKLLFQR